MDTGILAAIWFYLLAFVLLIYLALDGFDLGIGILSLFYGDETKRSAMMECMGSIWHANQTWLVILGGLLFGAFPLAYGIVLSALYIPTILMLSAFVFRGVALEFRSESEHKAPWSMVFGFGSLAAALAQGFLLGALVSGLKVEARSFAGGLWDWLTPFNALFALGLALNYVLLGSTYLVRRTEGELQNSNYRNALFASIAVVIVALAIGWWAVPSHPYIHRNWFVWPGFLATSLPLLLAVAAFFLLLNGILKRREKTVYAWNVVFLVLTVLGFASSVYPYIIPPAVTVGTAAAQPLVLKIMLGVTIVLLPVMIIYNRFQYRVFGGKVKVEGGRSY